MSILKSNLKHT